jgi:hypothetical protein
MRSEVEEGDGARLDDGHNGGVATAAGDDDARGWDVVHAGEKPTIAGTQDKPSDTAMTFILGWRMTSFELWNTAASGADCAWISIVVDWLCLCGSGTKQVCLYYLKFFSLCGGAVDSVWRESDVTEDSRKTLFR